MSTVDEVKQRLDIVDVVGQHAALQKAGRNFRALCPFHSERAPSFYVFPDRQTWHCFGACSTGGDVISFVMKKEGLEFRAALEMLAQRAGVALPAPAGEQADPRREAFRSANEEAARFFHHALLDSSEGARALEYVGGRGLDQDTIAAFQLGYAPDSWDGLKRHLSGLGFEERDLLAAGLDGIKNNYTVPEPIEENVYEMTGDERKKRGISTLPATLLEAVQLMEKSKLVKKALGDHVHEYFIRNKRAEWDAYKAQVSQYEIDKYLPIL